MQKLYISRCIQPVVLNAFILCRLSLSVICTVIPGFLCTWYFAQVPDGYYDSCLGSWVRLRKGHVQTAQTKEATIELSEIRRCR